MLRKLAVLGIAVFAVPAVVAAGVNEYQVDPVHSEVGFKIRHLVAKTPGAFGEYQGTIWLDPAKPVDTLKFSATIQAASIDTRNEKRDEHLRSPDFFEVEAHPEIKVVSKSVKKKGKETFEVLADVTMKGVTKEIPLEVELVGTGPNPWTGQPMVGLDITGSLNRQDFGIKWNKALDTGGFVLSDDVQLEVHIEAGVPKPEAAQS